MSLVKGVEREEGCFEVLSHSLVQCILSPSLKYGSVCEQLKRQESWDSQERQVFLQLAVSGLFLVDYYQTA